MRRVAYIIIVMTLLLFGLLTSPSTSHTEPPAVGDWTIEDNTTIENETIVIHGDVIVSDGGVLTLKNCVLMIDAKLPGWTGIIVEEKGELCMYDTTVTAYKSHQFYMFDVHGTLRIDGGGLSRMCLNGLNLDGCDLAIVKNTSIYNNALEPTGITVDNASATIIGNNIYGNYYGIVCRGSCNATIAENNIKSNIRVGIECIGYSNASIERNIVSENEYRGIDVLNHARVAITGNIISSNGKSGIACAENSTVVINNNVISNHPDKGIGIQENCVAEIIGNTIINNHDSGITCSDRTIVNITNNLITDSGRIGIGTKGLTTGRIVDNTIRSTVQGIIIFDSSTIEVIENTLVGNDFGIYSKLNPYGKLTVNNNYLHANSEAGIVVNFPSDVRVCNNTVSSSGKNGIEVLNGATPLIANSTILGSGLYDIYASDNSHPTIVNTKLDLNKLFFNDTESIVSVGYWVELNVRNSNNTPVQNAKVIIASQDRIEIFNGSTNYEGRICSMPVIALDMDYTDKKNYTPHTIYVAKAGLSESEQIIVDSNRVVDFILAVSDKLARGNLITANVDGHDITVEYSGDGNITITPVTNPPPVPKDKKDIGIFFNITATDTVEEIYITVHYNPEDYVPGTQGAVLKMYFWDGNAQEWIPVSESGVDVHNQLVWASVDHLTIFAPMAEEISKPVSSGNVWLLYGVASITSFAILFVAYIILKRKILLQSKTGK